MNDTNIDRILDNMMHIMPVFHRKLLRMDLGGVTDKLTRLHFAIMGVLSTANMTTTELAKMMMITKPQITHLVDQLVNLGIVERSPDAADRRVINLILTASGSKLLGEMKEKVRENVKNRLATLTSEELSEMLAALETLRRIGSKL
jgi:DNA-binding MarR family transcriptional regulator